MLERGAEAGGVDDFKTAGGDGSEVLQRSRGNKVIVKLLHCDTVDEAKEQCFQKLECTHSREQHMVL
jgi:hypothetical protein